MNRQLGLAFRIALREMRTGLRGFRVFIACLALGVGAIAGVGSLSEAIKAGLERDARRLLGGDVALRLLHRPAMPEQRSYLTREGALSEVIEMRAMARTVSGHKRTLVELKGVDHLYPLVGEIRLEEGTTFKNILSRREGRWGAIIESGLLRRLELDLGDRLRIGEAEFILTGVILSEPDRIASLWSLGPRIMVSSAALPDTELIQPGSQIRYSYRVLVPKSEGVANWIERLKAKFPTAGWRIRARYQATPGLKRFIDYITLFLTFVGLTTLLVGGVGVSNAVGSHLESKIGTIATFKCLGASGNLIFHTYFIQVFIFSGVGNFIGIIFG